MSGRVVAVAGTGFDIIDELCRRCGFQALRPRPGGFGSDGGSVTVAHGAGEYDYLTEGNVSRRDLRRLTGAGLVSPHGVNADQLAHIAGWDGDVSSFVEWYVTTGLAGLDQRASRRAGQAWESLEEPEPDDEPSDLAPSADDVPAECHLPSPVLEYLARLVFGDKADYAAEYAYAVHHGSPLPADPGTEWARKARSRIDSISRRAVK